MLAARVYPPAMAVEERLPISDRKGMPVAARPVFLIQRADRYHGEDGRLASAADPWYA